MRSIFIPADEAIPVFELEVAEEYPGVGVALAHLMQEDQVWIERVVVSKEPRVDMWVDEEGLLKGRPYNRRAVAFSKYQGEIVGDVVLLGETMVDTGEGYTEPDIAGLPASITIEMVEAMVR